MLICSSYANEELIDYSANLVPVLVKISNKLAGYFSYLAAVEIEHFTSTKGVNLC